jgi:hypothetical protein
MTGCIISPRRPLHKGESLCKELPGTARTPFAMLSIAAKLLYLMRELSSGRNAHAWCGTRISQDEGTLRQCKPRAPIAKSHT